MIGIKQRPLKLVFVLIWLLSQMPSLSWSRGTTPRSSSTSRKNRQPADQRRVAESNDLTAKMLREKNFNQVIGSLEKYEPKSTQQSLQLALAYQMTGQIDRANALWTAVLSDKPKQYEALIGLGRNHLKNENTRAEAIEHLKVAIQSQPKNKEAYSVLLTFYKSHKGYEFEARTLLTDMVQKFGSISSLITDLCYYNFEAGYTNQAEEICLKGTKNHSDRPENFIYLGLTYKNQGEDKKAKVMLKKAGDRFPASELAQWAIAQLEYDAQNYIAAEKHFQMAVKNDSESVRARLGLAQSLFKLKKYGEALPHFGYHCALSKMVSDEFRTASGVLLHERSEFHSQYIGEINLCSGRFKKR